MFDAFPYLGIALVVTIVLALLPWYGLSARQKQVSYVAIFGPPIFANVAVALGRLWQQEGWLLFTPKAWDLGRGGASADVVLAALSTVFCILSVWVIAMCLQKYTKRLRFPEGIVKAARKFTWRHPLVLWLAAVIPPAGYSFLAEGFDTYSPSFYLLYAIRAMLPTAGIGFTVGTCLAAGAFAIGRVRNGALHKRSAIVLVLAASGFAAVAPVATMIASGCYRGLGGLVVIFTGEVTICIAVLGLLISAISVICIRRH